MSQHPEPRTAGARPEILSGRRLDLVVTGVMLADTLAAGLIKDVRDGMPTWGWLPLMLGPLVFPLWRRHPRLVLVVSVGSVLASGPLGVGPLAVVPALVAIAVAMYTGYRALSVSTVFALSAVTALGNLHNAGWEVNGQVVERTLLVIGWLHVALISGLSRRQRDAYMAEAEHVREEAVKRKAADERVRIARELHDSLTHSISVIRVQAGVAIHLARKRGDEPPSALVAVEEAAKDATRELRETLTMLRDDDGHRLARVEDLADRYRGLGFTVEVDCAIDCGADCPVALDAEVDHAAYRIVQEALTNAVRHSSGDAVRVRVAREDGAVVVEVADNGTPGRVVPGRGLTGMRERVDALGGTLHVGPGEYGFTVRASLPDDTAATGTAATGTAEADAAEADAAAPGRAARPAAAAEPELEESR
ncbi:sensor histidine kinase [Glycomyces terrestris]|uniref:histidine kinase n=1 Tax=Glycomyces terrestris TaxID=2493553 RepID=A0A426UZ01_9ACTN|nr:sensor histidine kinase [Glycomyces terrestris]RRR99765.1 sensor histidine kinase [Glycomyces terrestris]